MTITSARAIAELYNFTLHLDENEQGTRSTVSLIERDGTVHPLMSLTLLVGKMSAFRFEELVKGQRASLARSPRKEGAA